uniref:Thioredoxin domain containing 8 n=1 Tax=Microcebus murinus TaxID=30608 RepID=A0A8C5VHZ1_MICMU
MVEILKDMNEFKTFLQAAGHKLVVVEFSAKWCGPCQRMYPIFHDLAESCHIRAIPTFQMFKKKEKQWDIDSSQARPSQTRANCRTLLKQLGK